MYARGSGEATRRAKRGRQLEKKKRETARLARTSELRVSLTMQNKIGWFLKHWQQNKLSTIENHWQVDDDWSNAGKFVTFPKKKKTLDTAQRET